MTALHSVTVPCSHGPNRGALSLPLPRRVYPHSLHQRQSGNHRRTQLLESDEVLAQKHGAVVKVRHP